MNRLRYILPLVILLSLSLGMSHAVTWTPLTGATHWFNISIKDADTSNVIYQFNAINITFNAGALFESYANGCFTNFEIFNGFSGNIPYQWLEGNTANTFQTCSYLPLNAVNSLSIWVNLPAGITAGTNAMNVLTIGFLPFSTNAMNGNNIGRNPLQDCPNTLGSGTGTINCAYGQFDNGANVFSVNGNSMYWNFLGPGVPTGWTVINTVVTPGDLTSNYVKVANGINMSLICTDGIGCTEEAFGTTGPTSSSTMNVIVDAAINMKINGGIAISGIGFVNSTVTSLASGFPTSVNAFAISYGNGGYCGGHCILLNIQGAKWGNSAFNTIAYPLRGIYSISALNNGDLIDYNNYTFSNTLTGFGVLGKTPIYPLVMIDGQNSGGGVSANQIVYWERMRPYTYVQPIVTIGTVQQGGSSYITPSNPTLTLSNTFIDQGQNILFNAGVSNGNVLFTYNYFVQAYNTVSTSNFIITNMLHTKITSRSDSWFWTPNPNLYVSNTMFNANVVITETGAFANTVNTIYIPFGYNAAMTTPNLATIPVFPTNIVVGNTVTLTASFSGGTKPYTYNYQIINTIDSSLVANMLFTNNGYTSNSWTWTVPIKTTPITTEKANVIITDSAASTNAIVNSIYSQTLTTNAATYPIPKWKVPTGVTNDINITLINNDPNNAIYQYNAIPWVANAGAAFEPYANNAFTNWVIFNGITGNIVYSTMVGNTANVFQTYGINTVNSLLFYIQADFTLPPGATITNALAIGFYPMSINSLNGNNIGEAAQLTCPNIYGSGGNSVPCAYGKYDNLGNVFISGEYSNFTLSGSSLPSGWKTGVDTDSGACAASNGNELIIANSVNFSTTSGGGAQWCSQWVYGPSYSGSANVVEDAVVHIRTNGANGADQGLQITNGTNIIGTSPKDVSSWTSLSYTDSPGLGCGSGCMGVAGPLGTESNSACVAVNVINVAKMGLYETGTIQRNHVYGALNNSLTNTLNCGPPQLVPLNPSMFVGTNGNGGGGANVIIYWVGLRIYLYDNPTMNLGPAQVTSTSSSYTSPSTPTLTLSNTMIDQGQSILFTAGVSNGNNLFAYNYFIVNSITNMIIANQLYTDVQFNSNTYFWTPPPNLYTANTFKANVVISEMGGYSNTVASSYIPFGYNAVLTVSVTPATNTIILPPLELQVWNAVTTGGTQTFTYNWIVINSLGIVANGLYIGLSSAFNLFYYEPLVVGNYQANIIVTDSATTKTSVFTDALLTLLSISSSTSTTTSSTTSTSTSSVATTTIYYSLVAYIRNATANPALISTTLPACANTIDGLCKGNDILTNGIMHSDLFINGNLLIPTGINLISNGHIIIVNGTFTLKGIIYTGSANNNGSSGTTTATNGISYLGSFGGSGGGGSSGPNPGGNGGSAPSPLLTNANILSMYTTGFINYLTGAGGGGGTCNNGGAYGGNTIANGGLPGVGGGGGGSNQNPGSGAYGIYIQANTFIGTGGVIEANGLSYSGAFQLSPCDQGGTGGGGYIIIANGMGTYIAATYNTLAGSPLTYSGTGGNGGETTYSYGITQPLTGGNVPYFDYYPINLYTNSLSTFLNFSLYQKYNGATTLVQANVININYTPPASQSTGVYNYSILEFQQGLGVVNSLQLNFSLNMTDVQNALVFNNPIDQYYTNLANITIGSFTSIPTSWKLWSYPNIQSSAYGVNTIRGSVFGSKSISFPVNVQLVYSFTTFNISLPNNPKIQTSITQIPLAFITSNTGGTWPYTRELLNISTYDQNSSGNILAMTAFGSQLNINNYTVQVSNSFTSNNYFQIYVPTSNAFPTQPIRLNTPTATTTATGYLQGINNFLSVTLTNTFQSYYIYLVSSTIASSQYELVTENVSLSTYIASTIQVFLFSPITNTSTLVSTLQTVSGSGVVTSLIIEDSYKFFAFSPGTNPQLIGQAGYTEATSCSPNDCLQVIPIGISIVPFLPTTIGTIIQNCLVVPGGGSTDTVSCTFLQTNTASTTVYTARVQIFTNYLLNAGNPTCTNQVTGTGGSVFCTVGNVGTTLYSYNFQIYIQGQWITVATGQFGTEASLFVNDGGLIALILMLVLALVFIQINLNLSMILAGAGLFIAGLLGFIVLPTLAGGAILLFLGVILYIVNRDPANNR